ncbi:putative plasmamembrane-ATPase [Lentinula aff. lateritia]|uniref:Plasmamembrane-ATPase n=1 Tax=Lentinula aff. lateritia TaxID=2804960 RepID=A0ACC1TJS6_9AGAR|nr:putative plasmamembrane-ATPase [Lentinula aff. lateritia]
MFWQIEVYYVPSQSLMCLPGAQVRYEVVKHLQGLSHLCAMTGNSCANVGIAIEGATNAAHGAADIILTEPGLSAIVHTIHGSHIIFQHMRNYSIYACAVTIHIVVCFAILAWYYLVAYGLYLTLSILILVVIILESNFFQNKFGVTLLTSPVDPNDEQHHTIVYLQVAIISQALIFVTHSRGFFFMEHPSFALMGVFCVAQLISSIIAACSNWGFTDMHGISGEWIGIIWVWNIVWFIPLDWTGSSPQ